MLKLAKKSLDTSSPGEGRERSQRFRKQRSEEERAGHPRRGEGRNASSTTMETKDHETHQGSSGESLQHELQTIHWTNLPAGLRKGQLQGVRYRIAWRRARQATLSGEFVFAR